MLPDHLVGLKKTTETVVTKEGRVVEIWEFEVPTDTAVLDAWALSFRQQYCSDEELPVLIEDTGKTIAQYLTEYVFPDRSVAPGPSMQVRYQPTLLSSRARSVDFQSRGRLPQEMTSLKHHPLT